MGSPRCVEGRGRARAARDSAYHYLAEAAGSGPILSGARFRVRGWYCPLRPALTSKGFLCDAGATRLDVETLVWGMARGQVRPPRESYNVPIGYTRPGSALEAQGVGLAAEARMQEPTGGYLAGFGRPEGRPAGHSQRY